MMQTAKRIAAIVLMGFFCVSSLRAQDGGLSTGNHVSSNNAVDQRIQKYRTTEATLTLSDATGKPLTNTAVRVEMKHHKFLFGCNVFLLGKCGSDELNTLYARRFSDLFNFATLPFYWGSYEHEQGKPAEAQLRKMADWCRANGIRPKGHPLCYFLVEPEWLTGKSVDEVEQLQLARIRREVAAFSGLIDIWDVANEVVLMPTHQGGKSPISSLCKERGQVGLLQKAFGAAVAGNPNGFFLLNDWCPDQRYVALLTNSIAAGARIDGIGLQSHMHGGYFGTNWLWQTCERFAPLKKPIHFTELTILSTSEKKDYNDHTPWNTTPEGEQQQAKQVVETYRWLFSHPAVEAITWWDFSDLNAWRSAPAGLLRKDMSPKPAYTALLKLIKNDWWTPPQELKTDSEGRVKFHGFLGEYLLKTPAGEKKFHLTSAGQQEIKL